VTTTAKAGGAGSDGTGVGGAVAISVVQNATEARLGSGAALSVLGGVEVLSAHHGSSTTEADGTALGADAAVGAAIALGFVSDSASAQVERDMSAGGGLSVGARADGTSRSQAKASAAGADKDEESASGNSTADDQTSKQANLANSKSGGANSVDQSADDGNGGAVGWRRRWR
jgi:hypothetical protein